MATIVVADGPGKGQKFALTGCRLAMIGRDAASTFQIVDPELSRFHLQIRHEEEGGGRDFAVDFQSKNGVYVNEKRIEKETLLMDGDVIKIGGSTLLYTLDDAVDAQNVANAWKRLGQGHLGTVTGD